MIRQWEICPVCGGIDKKFVKLNINDRVKFTHMVVKGWCSVRKCVTGTVREINGDKAVILYKTKRYTVMIDKLSTVFSKNGIGVNCIC